MKDELDTESRTVHDVKEIGFPLQTDQGVPPTYALLRAIAEGTGALIFAKDLAGRWIMANAAAARYARTSVEEIIGKTDEELWLPEIARELRETDQKVLRAGRAQVFRERVTVGAETRVLLTVKAPLRDESGKIVGLVGIAHDITEREQTEEALRVWESNYRAIFNAADDAIFVHDPDTGNILDVNERACQMFGYTPEELRRSSVEDLSSGISPYTQARAVAIMKEVVARQPQLVEWMVKHKSGRQFWAEVNVKRTVIGGKERVVAVVRDIAERKRAEERLRESEEKLRRIVASSPNAIVVTDRNGIVLECNQAAWAMLGFSSPNELVGKSSLLFMAEKDQQRAVANMERTMAEGVVRNVEYTLLTKDGKAFPAELSASVLGDGLGNPVGFMAIITDISERKRAEATLRESESRFRGLAENIRELFYMYDRRRQRFLYVSPAYEEIWGRGSQSLYDEPASGLAAIHPEDRGRVVRARCGSAAEGYFSGEYRVVRPDGSVRWVWDRCGPMRDEEGRPSRLVGIVEDMTERRGLAEEMRRLRAEARRHERLADLVPIAARIMHEVGNPLAGLIIQGQVLLRSASSGETGDALVKPAERIVSELRHLEEMIRDFRGFVGQQHLQRQTIDLRHFLKMIVGLWLPVGNRRDITLEVAVAGDAQHVYADEDGLRQAVDNLIKNALEALGRGPGWVHIRVVRLPAKVESVRISVEDSGPGIPEGVDPFRLFETTKPEGLGLGLPIAQQVALAHGGSLEFERLEPRGTAFHLDIPS